MQKRVTKNVFIEDLIDDYPKSVKFLSEKNIKCIACGEPIWGTLEEACKEKGYNENQIEIIEQELNKYLTENKSS